MATTSIVFQADCCAIIQYPEWLRVALVDHVHGQNKVGQSVEEERVDLKCRHSRKRHRSLNEGEELQLQYHNQVRDFLKWCYAFLIDTAKKSKYFPVAESSDSIPNGNCSVDLGYLCNINSIEDLSDCEDPLVLTLHVDEDVNDVDVIGKVVCNSAMCDLTIRYKHQLFLVPARSSFLLSDISKVHLLASYSTTRLRCCFSGQQSLYNIIVIDPPWENKSAMRGKKYQWLENEDILQLPVTQFAAIGCLVCVWVTNKQRLVEWVKETLFPYWNVQLQGEWFWLKVTSDGDMVFELNSPHKKPYEILLIGRKMSLPTFNQTKASAPPTSNQTNNAPPTSNQTNNAPPTSNQTDNAPPTSNEPSNDTETVPDSSSVSQSVSFPAIPDKYVFMCVPSRVHSQKPFIGDLLKQYIGGSDVIGLELFARNLVPGWTSWGNEVLKFQAVSTKVVETK